MSIADWFNSEPVRNFRKRILKNQKLSECSRCYAEEDAGGNSRRFNANQKSVIFRQAFEESFKQSPGHVHFVDSGYTTTQPIDIHVDLGNYCNLACKMCNAQASSRIAAQEVKWGIESSKPFVGTNWTNDPAVWSSFKQQLLAIPQLNNIHFMGGETLLTDRFEDLVDTLIAHNRFDVCLSFVTNGTVFKPQLLTKLLGFKRVGIEISIETVEQHNSYVRQGTDTQLVLDNIVRYQEQCNGSNVTVTLRPTVSALTIGYYGTLLQYALQQKLLIKSLQVVEPKFMQVGVLPQAVRSQYLAQYTDILDQLNHTVSLDYNASDPNNYQIVIKQQAQACVNLLNAPETNNLTQLQTQLVDHCRKWDKIYNHSALVLYPELAEMWKCYAY
jgi:organic radical activating enzyme